LLSKQSGLNLPPGSVEKELPPGGVAPNTDHSEVEKILKKNLHLLKNKQGELEKNLT
jgi:hypothetical protein